MKVYAYMGDAWACGHYRVMWPGLAAAGQAGCEVQVVSPSERAVAMHIDKRTGRIVSEHFPEDADAVIFQRPSSAHVQQVIPLLQARGVAVVVDMDDDLTCIDPRNPAAAGYRPNVNYRGQRMANLHSFHNASDACRLADLVTVTTPALASRYGRDGHALVLPNMVPAPFCDIPHVDSDLIGWGGVVASHPDDLQAVGPALARLTRRDGLTFATVGDKHGVQRALGLHDEPGGPGNVEFADWAGSIAQFGIGIAPLARTRFNEAKSRLKPLEYAAVGVPAVASPLPDYQAFADEGGCMVAGKPREWEGILRTLARDAGRRAEMSERGRAVARANTYEGHGWRWAEAWALACDRRRSTAALV